MKFSSSLKTAVLLSVILSTAFTAASYNFMVDGIYYDINGNNATVVNSPDFPSTYSGDVVIPESVAYNDVTYPVTAIAEGAFYSSPNLTGVSIPNSVTSIGGGAFGDCNNLKTVIIPNSVTAIEPSTFFNCWSLTSINLPNSITTIGYGAFYYCTGLTSITIPASVTFIETGVFDGCTAMESIAVEEGNAVYDSRDNCNAIIETASNTLRYGCKNSTIPSTVVTIGGSAFSGCVGLTNIDIPNSVTYIGGGAFYGCINLNSIVFPTSVTAIYGNAFHFCTSLTSVNIPNTVVYIGEGAFSACSSMQSITVASDNTNYDSRNNCNAIIETASNTLIAGCNSTSIPSTVTAIGYCAFESCPGLTSLTLPDAVVSIGIMAFGGCDNLSSISFPKSISTIDNDAFSGCRSLTSVVIPQSLDTIYGAAFYNCSALKEVVWNAKKCVYQNSHSVWGGLVDPFSDCYSLTNIVIGKEVESIDDVFGTKYYSWSNYYIDTVTCLAPVPPAITAACFASKTYNQAVLSVPKGSLQAYQTAEGWKEFNKFSTFESIQVGDVNADGEVTVADMNIVIDLILGFNYSDEVRGRADVNGDKEISVADINVIIDIILNQ